MMGYPDPHAERSITRLPSSWPLAPYEAIESLHTLSFMQGVEEAEMPFVLQKSRCSACWAEWSLHLGGKELPNFPALPEQDGQHRTSSSLTTVGKSSLISVWIWLK